MDPRSSPSKKRLLADPKPEQRSVTASPDSALSSDSLSDRFKRKTRELPNLSDCHGCGLRIDNSNPKERLRTLDSVWRIVLLCKKCIKLVNSRQTCPYCFKEIPGKETDYFQCGDCEHRIHRDCVVKFGGFAPWSYCSESEFSVCVDCWVPKLLVNSIRVFERRKNNNNNIGLEQGDSRVTGSSKVLEKNKVASSLEYMVKDANCVVNSVRVFERRKKKNKIGLEQGDSRVTGSSKILEKNKVASSTECVVKDANCVVNSVRVFERRKKKNTIDLDPGDSRVTEGDSRVTEGNSRVLEINKGAKSLENVVKGASCVLEKKINVAAKAKENALRKAVTAKRAVELANNALHLMAKKDENWKRSESLVTSSGRTDNTETRVVDDAELAFQLHRAMNSSPRISRNLCSINSSCLAVPKIRDCNSNLAGKLLHFRSCGSASVSGKLEVVTNSKFNEKLDRIVSECSVCDKDFDSHSNDDLGELKPKLKTYTRKSKRRKECLENGEIGSHSGDGHRRQSESQSCQKEQKSSNELGLNDITVRCLRKFDGNNTVLKDGKCNGKPDRYLLKYSKRPTGLKEVSRHCTEFLCDDVYLENPVLLPDFL
ncbi:unnamed protein product [Ilex paraguariensis]|uniref:Uncharacterized protein n=1 Tax=Ilex paraguariensis TaxID=185542 RepID=A0ABC8REK6_9AQUA